MSSKAITEKPEPEARPGHRDVAREWAPSVMAAEEPTVARWIGGFGLTFWLVGTATLAINLLVTGWAPRIGVTGGMLFFIVGLVGMLYHAARDGDLQIRRAYAIFGLLWLVGAGIALFYQKPYVTAQFLRWGYGPCILALLFLLAFVRHETDAPWRAAILALFALIGTVAAVSGLSYGIVSEEFFLSYGLPLAVLGLVYLWAFIAMHRGTEETSPKVFLWVGLAAALLGLSFLAVNNAFFFSYAGGAAFLLLVCLWAYNTGRSDDLGQVVGLCVGAAGALVFSIALVRWLLPTIFPGIVMSWGWATPGPFLASVGLIQMAAGLIYAAVAVGLCSENRFIVLTRRELAAFFYSPLAYFIILGFAVVGAIQFCMFVDNLTEAGGRPEPIIMGMVYSLIPVVWMIFAVPLLTMRLFSEEQRTGTMEVLLTAPVNDLSIVLSKFCAVLTLYLMGWLPFGLFLIALRIEGGLPFDYRPTVSFALALVCSGANFLAMGLFFSSLTRNQIVAAILAGASMVALIVLGIISERVGGGSAWATVTSYVSFLQLWQTALLGKLALKDVAFHISAAVIWLFLTLKVLESRKWR